MPNPLTIAAIAFDLGNVLIKVDHFRFCQHLAELIEGSAADIYRQVFSPALEHGYDTGQLTSQIFYQKIIDFFQIELPYPRFCHWWNDIFDPLQGMEEMVLHLKTKYPLYLLSNTNPLHFQYVCQKFPLIWHCRRFILSYQVGSRKPEDGIYQALIQETGLPPQRCLFIDDKLPFVEAAQRHGLMAWHFTTPGEFKRRLQEHGLW